MKRNELHFAQEIIPEETNEMLETCLKHVSTGLQFLHSKGIVHRDIKPANILYDSSLNWKITDFGLSRLIDTSMTSESGTPDYFAPEQVSKHYDSRVDIYAFGLVAFEIGFPMKTREDRRHWFTIFRTGQSSFPDVTKTTADLFFCFR